MSRFWSDTFTALVVASSVSLAGCSEGPPPVAAQDGPQSFVRYEYQGSVSYGILEGNQIAAIEGGLFGARARTGQTVALADARLLAPVEPGKVIAVGLNYLSHLGDREPSVEPGLFAKYPSSIIATGDPVVQPADSENMHFEGEMVLVIGETARHVSPEDAHRHVFGVTAGNDISERDWQASDLQWLRAKASDGFGPVGPAVVRGLDYGDLLLTTRLNGEVVQSERTVDLIFDVPTIVSYVSRYVTLEPGDLIFTGTPGSTSAMSPGDVVEVELEGVGILRNPIEGVSP